MLYTSHTSHVTLVRWLLENCRVPRKRDGVQVLGTTKSLFNAELESNAITTVIFLNHFIGISSKNLDFN